VLSLIAKSLASQDESGGLVIGDLIIHLLRRAGESVLPVLPELLQAMIGRMTTAKTATFLQVIIPFAYCQDTEFSTEPGDTFYVPDQQSTRHRTGSPGVDECSRPLGP
jgi:hypothetical protein